MPAVFGFAELRTAKRLKDIAEEPVLMPESIELDDAVGWVLKTPAGGIPGLTDPDSTSETTEVPSALCETWALVEVAGKVYRRKVKNAEGEHLKVRVANMDGEEIPENKFIRASRVAGGAFLVDYSPCG